MGRCPGAILRLQYEQPSIDACSTTRAWDRGKPSRIKQHVIFLM